MTNRVGSVGLGVLLEAPHDGLEPAGVHGVVVVEVGDEFAPGVGQPAVPGAAHPAMGNRQYRILGSGNEATIPGVSSSLPSSMTINSQCG